MPISQNAWAFAILATALSTEPVSAQQINLEGQYRCVGACQNPTCMASIKQNGSQLEFTNEVCQRSSGTLNGSQVVAHDWGELIGDLSSDGRTINWRNPTTWVRVASTSVSQSELTIEAYDFCYTPGRDFSQQVTNLFTTDELKYVLIAVCAAYGTNCSQLAQALQTGASYSEITQSSGDESNGIIRVPMEYEVCHAALDMAHASMTGHTHFNTTIMRSGDDNGLGYTVYAKTEGGIGPPRNWVDARLFLTLVPSRRRAEFGCPPLPSRAWDCTVHALIRLSWAAPRRQELPDVITNFKDINF